MYATFMYRVLSTVAGLLAPSSQQGVYTSATLSKPLKVAHRTSGLGSVAAKAKRKNDYDPKRQWGLQPNSQQDQSEDVGSTYVFSGHIIKGSSNDPDRFSRERQTREQKKLAALESERALEKLLKRDKEGMQSVMKARQVLGGTKRKKESGKEELNSADTPVNDAEELDEEHVHKKRKSLSAFQVMKLTGFDPISAKHGEPRQATEDVKKKVRLGALKRCCYLLAHYSDGRARINTPSPKNR
jgi:minichromosome maintenance protein 10